MQGSAQMSTNEPELIARHRRGDKSAFRELVRTYKAPVNNYLFRCGLPSRTRGPLLTEIFTTLHRAEGYQPRQSLKTWIFTTATRIAREHLDRVSVQKRVLTRGPTDNAPARSADQWLVTDSPESTLEEGFQELPVIQRQILVLCCVEHLTAKEVAGIVDAPEAEVEHHLRRGRLGLARALARSRMKARK